jgi:hypothetical protein
MDPLFEAALDGLGKMGASVSERELVDHLARHSEEEGALLGRYQRFAQEAASPAVRYLVQLIVEEEKKHHRLLGELANAIAWEWSDNSPVPATPELSSEVDTSSSLAQETKDLLAAEKRDSAELHRLRKELKPYEETTMWSLIVELMLLDTEKHQLILRFISRHL